MKHGTPRHPKMYALAARLKLPLFSAVGILEMLWEFTGDSCPRGDIGSIPDKEIAKMIGWTKRASVLIEALCAERWLDRDEKHRLVVHDWPEHAETNVWRKLIRARKDFLPCYGVSVKSLATKNGKSPNPFATFESGFVDSKKDIEKTDTPRASHAHEASALVKAQAQTTTVREFQEMRSGLEGYVRRLDGSSSLPPPDDAIVEKCLRAGGGASAEDIIKILRFLHQNGQSPGESGGPKSWAWFPAVIGRQFAKSKGAVA